MDFFRMKTESIFGPILVAFLALGSMPPLASASLEPGNLTLEAILERVAEANGGERALQETTNLRVIGEVSSGEEVYEFLLLKKRPDKVRIKLMFKGRTMETGFDGEVAWQRLRQGGEERTRILTSEELAQANLDLDFDGPLIGDPLPGYTRSFVGVERIDRADYLVIQIDSDRERSFHYIDPRTFREARTIRHRLDDGEVADTVVTRYFQYKRHGVIWLAERVERDLADGSEETILVRQAEVDPGILDRAFAAPMD